MHYHIEVWVPNSAVEDGVTFTYVHSVLQPYKREYGSSDGFWDRYKIGGRWTGAHDGYDPTSNINNYETCHLCGGTGMCNDSMGKNARAANFTYTCHVCGDVKDGDWVHGKMGPGKALKWPSDWEPYAGDVLPLDKVRADLTSYVLIVEDEMYCSDVYHPKRFDGNVKNSLKKLGITDGYLVTVDCHY